MLFHGYMQIHRSLTSLPPLSRTVLTIGTFDGVHLGHRQILHQLIAEAQIQQASSVLISFHPHPRSVVELTNPVPLKLLSTPEEKIWLIEKAGVEHLVIVPFDGTFASMEPEAYIEHFLWHYFHPVTIIIGYDHRFGHGRKGDFHLMGDYGQKLGFAVKEIPARVINESAVSSTRIRNAISQGNLAEANALLGREYSFSGMVVRGNQLGRTIGYPTANLQTDPEKLLPARGVYAIEAVLDNHGTVKGMMNIGLRPTISGTQLTTEVNLFDFEDDIYGHLMRVYPISFIREEQKFDGLESLKKQLASDASEARSILDS